MNTVTVLFYFFSAVLLFSAFRVVTAKNPVHAVLFLVLSFFQAAMIWMLLKAEFLSIALVLFYVGAVMVLFLFVVMMLDIKIENMHSDFWKKFPVAALIGTESQTNPRNVEEAERSTERNERDWLWFS